jgi:small subunit ribosomal protein S6
MNRNYETVFITNPNTTEARLTELHNRTKQTIEASKGKILNLDDWGKRKLAYPIKKETKGHYYCLTYNADTACVAELERSMRINEDVVRFLTVKIDEKVDPMAAIMAYKNKLEARAKREKERAEEEQARRQQAAEEFAGEAEE